MANHQLGPETPRPFSVITENHVRRHISISHIPEHERFSFGSLYEAQMCELIAKYLELDPHDRLCYVGESRGSLSSTLQTKFCLKPEAITSVSPGHIHYEQTPNHRMLPVRVADVGAQQFFNKASQSSPGSHFDKVLFMDATRYLENPRKTFEEVLRVLSGHGRILVVQRPASMNSLPVFSEARKRLEEADTGYLQLIRALQACGLDVQWEVECLKATLNKSQWYAMLKEHFPAQMEAMSPHEVTTGLRELSEGLLKYGDDTIEFTDRLLFISASRVLFSDIPHIARYGQPAHASDPLPPKSKLSMTYEMEVPESLQGYIKSLARKQGVHDSPNFKQNRRS